VDDWFTPFPSSSSELKQELDPMRQFFSVSILIACLAAIATSNVQPTTAKSQHAVLNASATSLTLEISARDLETNVDNSSGVLRDALTLREEGTTMQYGKPILPAIIRILVVPPQAGLELAVESGTPRIVPAEREPLICTDTDPHLCDSSVCHVNIKADPTHIHEAATSITEDDNGVYPAQIAEMSEPFLIRGVRLVRLTTYPVQYDAVNKQYLHHDDIKAEIRFTNDAPVNPSLHPIRRNRSLVFKKFIADLAINGNEVGRDDPDRDMPPAYLGHYLVVSHPNALRFTQPFIEWRRRQGYKVDILRLADNAVGSGNEARTKAAIKERWDAYVDNNIDPFDYIMLVGDHESYDDVQPAAGWIIPAPIGSPCWNGNTGHHFDYNFACLDDGNDIYADVGISRWAAGSEDLIGLNWLKTKAYEIEPWFGENGAIGDTAWFDRAAVYGQHWSGSWHVSLHTTVRWAVEVMQKIGFNDVRHYEDIDRNEGQGEGVGPFIASALNDGCSVMAGRAENYHFRSTLQGMRDDRWIFPIDMDVAGHHEWSCWRMLRTGTRQNLIGPVAATTGWGNLGTGPNNVVWSEMVNGFLLKDMPYAWSRMQGVIAPTTYIPNFYQQFPCIPTDVQYYGDPAIQPWLGVPRRIHATFTENITTTTSRVDVQVLLDDDDSPVPGADVTLYFPGSMPAADNNGYATYTNMQMWMKKSDENGMATFVFDDAIEFVDRTKMYVTVSGRDIRPFLGERDIGVPDSGPELASYFMSEIEGNGDEFLNPGERFDLHLTAANIGDSEELIDLSADVTSGSPYVEVEATNLWFGNIAAGSEFEAETRVPLYIRPDCPDGVSRPLMRPVVNIQFHSGETNWESAIKLVPHAPHLEFVRVVSGSVIPDSTSLIDIEIANVGSVDSPPLTARLSNMGLGVTAVNQEISYDRIPAGEMGRVQGDRFTISGNKVAVPGSKTKMMLTLTDNNGFFDTTYFELQVRTPRANAPQGPDKYGYICFDDTDTLWDSAPDYEWVEIDTRIEERDFDGTELRFTGRSSNDIGEAMVIGLPFITQFYGYDYDSITVATNGFIAVGSQRLAVNYTNWPLDRCIGGGVGMIAPFWDRLALGQNGKIFTCYDQEKNRFIIEWSRVRHQQGQNDLTFQVILLDKAVWITESGDQDVVFQYKTISQTQGPDQAWLQDSPFASVGINSPDGDAGITYGWNNQYDVSAAPLAARRALKFSTSPKFRSGMLYGYVTDAATGAPVENAIVLTEHGFIDYSDENGFWQIVNALADVPFGINCSRLGYNDSSLVNLDDEDGKYKVLENDSLQIDFNLLHPEFGISHENLGSSLEPGQDNQLPFWLYNSGNGPLTWSAQKELIGDANARPWEFRRSYDVAQTLQDDRIEGVAFAEDLFFLSGARGDSANTIYVLDRDGNPANSFTPLGDSRCGMRDLEWDGELLWGSGEQNIYGFTTSGDSVFAFEGPFNPTTCIAYDNDEDILWMSGTTTNIVGYNRAGEPMDRVLNRKGLRIYGLSYWSEDPDGYCLYVLTTPAQAIQNMYKMNTTTGDTILVKHFPVDSSAAPGGAFICNTFDVYSWVVMDIQNIAPVSGGDKIAIWQLDARKDWMELDSYSGLLQTGEGHDFTLSLMTAGLPDTLFQGLMRFNHNADDGEMILNISLNVMRDRPPEHFNLALPADGDTLTALPMHGEGIPLPAVRFAWNPSHDPNDLDVLQYRLTLSVGDQTTRLPLTMDTTMSLNPDTLGLPISFDTPLTWWVEAVSDNDVVASDATFRLRIIPDDIDQKEINKPFEFSLEPAWPNPFNGRTTIKFSLDKDAFASLRLYDLSGRVAMNLLEGENKAGLHRVALDGEQLASGVYMLKLESEGKVKIQKLMLVR